MYSKYGKCKTRKSSKESDKSEKSAESGKSEDEKPVSGEHGEDEKPVGSEHGEDEKPIDGEHGEDEDEAIEGGAYRKKSSQTRDPDQAGFPDTDEDDPTRGSDERFPHSHTEDELEGGESGPGIEGETAVGGESDGFDNDEISEDSETSGEESSVDGKKRKRIRAVMEYDLKDMYPEMNVLIQKKKREWDFQDPDIIRALWLETKTLALSEWKVRNAKIKINKPSFEVKETRTVALRHDHLRNKAELEQALQERDFEMTEASRNPPHFDAIQLATNLTTDMRYKYNRNNPPVPSHYIEHFEKFKKPPFKNQPIWYVYS